MWKRPTPLGKSLRRGGDRLETLMSLVSRYRKQAVDTTTWLRAAYGQPEAVAEVARHCEIDVRGMEDVYCALEPYIRTWNEVAL